MDQALRQGVFAVAIHSDLVILDAKHDDYFCIVDALETATDRSLRPEAVAALAEAGLLSAPRSEASTAEQITTAAMRDWRDLPPPLSAGVTPLDFLRFCAALAWAAMHFRRHRLPGLFRLLPSRPTGCPAPHPLALAGAVARFQAMLLWLPARPLCLFHSFLLLRYLSNCGLSADWVIAVELYPFQAHCWLASGEFVVGDEAHRLGAYRPILIHPGIAE